MKKTVLLTLVLMAVVLPLYSSDQGPRSDGPYEIYHDNGQLMMRGAFREGKRDGPYETYHENGQLKSKGTFKNGFEDGPYEAYYDNGQLRARGALKYRGWDGPWESYYRDGRVMEKGIYKYRAKCGNWEERGDSIVTLTIRLPSDSTMTVVLEEPPVIYDPCPPDLEGGN